MDYTLAAGTGEKNGNDTLHEATETNPPSQDGDSLKSIGDHVMATSKGEVVEQSVGDTGTGDVACEVNMEAAIATDDVIRAGGFGARDDIGSFLPVAIDSTDFEASLRDARDFEEPQGETARPGLGWDSSADEDTV